MLDEEQVRRAAVALLKHVKKSDQQNLLEDEGEVITAQLALHKMAERGVVKIKPIPIRIPHPLRRREDCDICMFVKDDAKKWIKEMMEVEPIDRLTKVKY